MGAHRGTTHKGSRRWILRVAEATAWGTAGVLFLILHSTDLPTPTYRSGLALVTLLGLWIFVTFRVVFPRVRRPGVLASVTVPVGLAFAGAAYGLLRGDVPSVQLTFVPVILVTGLVTGVWGGLTAAVVAGTAYLLVGELSGPLPGLVGAALNIGIFVLSGGVSGLLTRELEAHYSGEQEEHRVAAAVRHRLLAVLDSVGEGIVFRDRQGIVRIVNQRAEELFDIAGSDYLGEPAVGLLRTVARQTEDPEGFMETFQALRNDPQLELREWVDQIIPERRQLRLHSRPTFDDSGIPVGRIDVYTDVTDSVARAAEVERLYEDARKTAESYQRGLLPSGVPSLVRTNLVAHYIAAAGRRAVCGDFYDFVPLEGGRQGVILGDVCGVGPAAANDAALTRYSLRSFATEESDPAALLARLNRHLVSQTSSERFVRLFVGVLDPERAILEYASAGHVPPVVYRARSAKVEWLSERGTVLGIDEHAAYEAERVELDPGDMLVLYTDGVTEAGRAGRPFGQGKFADLVEQYGVGTPGELVQAIRRAVESWVDGELRDDLAMLACQVVPEATVGEPARELVVPNEPARISDVRSFVASFLAHLRAPVEDSQEMLLAVGEAVANACRHGRKPAGRSEIRVRCSLDGEEVTVTVSDDGPGFDTTSTPRHELPDRFASGGRGLFLMRQLVDSVAFESSGEGTTVSLTRRMAGVGASTSSP